MDYVKAKQIVEDELLNCLEHVHTDEVEDLIDAIINAKQVFVVGIGRVLLMLEAFAKRLNHIGIPAYFVGEINEPALTKDDLLIVGSGSGESAVPVAIAKVAKKHNPKIAYIGSNLGSTVAQMADLCVRIPCRTKLALPDEMNSVQPMSSLFEQSLLLVCDIIAFMAVTRKNINIHDLWQKHANLE